MLEPSYSPMASDSPETKAPVVGVDDDDDSSETGGKSSLIIFLLLLLLWLLSKQYCIVIPRRRCLIIIQGSIRTCVKGFLYLSLSLFCSLMVINPAFYLRCVHC